MNKPLTYIVVALLAVAAVFLYFDKAQAPSPSASPTASGSPRACTMEAKLCPDGSAVGRTGPNCEFAPCPTPIKTVTPPIRY